MRYTILIVSMTIVLGLFFAGFIGFESRSEF